MSKLANMLNMVLLLKKNGKMKLSQLSEELGVSTRQIRSYNQDLEMSGIYIKSETGKDGGYSLEENDFKIPFQVMINAKDKLLIQILASNSNINIKEAFNQYINFVDSEDFNHVFSTNTSVEEVKHLLLIHNAINQRRAIQAEYLLKNNQRITKIVHPYFTLRRYQSWYLLCFDTYHKKTILLKVNRVLRLDMLDERYMLDNKLFKKEKQRLTETVGITDSKESYQVIIKIRKKIEWVLDQFFEGDIETINKDDKFIKVSFITHNLYEIKRQILFMGKDCEIIEPKELINLISNEVKEINNLYETRF